MTRSNEWLQLPNAMQGRLEGFQRDLKVPLGQIAENLGLIVKLSTLPANISGEIRPSREAEAGFIIKINRHEAKTRQRFTLAHEIAHFLLHRDKIGNGISDNVMYRSSLSNDLEAQANRLAADLIMPWNTLSNHIRGKNLNDSAILKTIAEEFGVSTIALRIRLGMEV